MTATGGHLGSNLGVVELTLALHRTFDSPKDVLLWDTGHQAYVHKLVTGRRSAFTQLRQAGGLSGYPNRTESEHDWVENSHASTILSYAHGLASAFELQGKDRRVVAVVGDGALTGGMAYEALNNLGHSGKPVLIVLNDNGRSYAPTVSRLSLSLTHLRLNPAYIHARQRIRHLIRELPGVGDLAYSGRARPHQRTARGGHAPHLLRGARHPLRRAHRRPRHRRHGAGPGQRRRSGPAPSWSTSSPRRAGATPRPRRTTSSASTTSRSPPRHRVRDAPPAPICPVTTFTDAFTRSLLRHAESDPRIVAITAAMPGPTGLLPFEARFPDRFLDVGIAEQHAVTAAAGMAMAGMRPVVAVYSTFFSRAFDQANLDVGLHRLPVVFVLDRAGITGDDGPSHHGVLDMALALSIPGMTVFAPSSAPEVEVMLDEALTLDGPSVIRFPKTPAPRVADRDGRARASRPGGPARGDGSVCILAVGKMLTAAEAAADELGAERDRRHGVGRPGGLRPRSGHAGRCRPPPGWWSPSRTASGRAAPACSWPTPCAGRWASAPLPRSSRSGCPARYIAQGKPDRILAELGLDGPGLARVGPGRAAGRRRGAPRELAGRPGPPLPARAITNDALD